MEILLVSTSVLTVPPLDAKGNRTYGGLEQVVYDFAKGLTALGEKVTIVAPQGSKPPENVNLIPTVVRGRFDSEHIAFNFYKNVLHHFDVIGDSSWYKISYSAGDYLNIIGTMHSPCPFQKPPRAMYSCLAGVSRAHSIYANQVLNVPVRTIYNPVDISQYQMIKGNTEPPRYLSLNRICPEKGIDTFVDWIAYAGANGDIVGDDSTIIQNKDYPKLVKQKIDGYHATKRGQIRYFGLTPHEKKMELLHSCRAVVLLPASLPTYLEVFGLAAVEALACGKPVICYETGGLCEIVENGVSGYFVKDKDEFKIAIRKIENGSLKPEDCRKRAEYFSIEERSKDYLNALQQVNKGNRW